MIKTAAVSIVLASSLMAGSICTPVSIVKNNKRYAVTKNSKAAKAMELKRYDVSNKLIVFGGGLFVYSNSYDAVNIYTSRDKHIIAVGRGKFSNELTLSDWVTSVFINYKCISQKGGKVR